MAESLLAILLVTGSAKGSSLAYRWPPLPVCSPRLSRARPDDGSWPSQLDNPWRASHATEAALEQTSGGQKSSFVDNPEYHWHRPVASTRYRTLSLSNHSLNPPPDRAFTLKDEFPFIDEYDQLFGYQVDFLASLLLPHRSMCHQKFELLVDDLAFIGHPVRADNQGRWRFETEKLDNGPRGREITESKKSSSPLKVEADDDGLPPTETTSQSEWLHCFHLVFVLDLPDPSSSASGNLSKYFDIIYEQIAFTTTAVLFQEQVINNFVEQECDKLGSLKDSCLSKGEPYTSFANQGFELSSIAATMRVLFESIKDSKMAYLKINNFPLELQLPPYLDTLLHGEDEIEMDYLNPPDEDSPDWGPEMDFGWRLPTLAPWKCLLLLDEQKDADPYKDLRNSSLSPEDRNVAEGLIKFMETASVTLSLADMASLLDWDLDTQVYPIVRWLVYHRCAKVVDTIHAGLKTAFAVPARFDSTLGDLAAEFAKRFTHPAIPPLPRILATISSSLSKQTENHFFACIVKSKELIPIFQDAVLWMLKRDLLITLHLRIRIVAPPDLKLRVQLEREVFLRRKKQKQKGKGRVNPNEEDGQELDVLPWLTNSGLPWISLSPKNRNRRLPSNESENSHIEMLGSDDELDEEEEEEDDDEENGLINDSSWENDRDNTSPSIISDPARATPIQRRWLSAMSDGKDPYVAKRFELINQYFDGKCSDDEILYRAEISRKQLREVLHHYEEYLQTFLHPS